MNMDITMRQKVMKRADMIIQRKVTERAVTIMPETVIMYTNIIMTKHVNALHVREKRKLKVTSLLQDNAVVVSAEYHTAADRGRAGKLLTEYMEALAGEIDSRGGIIGHIKTSVEMQVRGNVFPDRQDRNEKRIRSA